MKTLHRSKSSVSSRWTRAVRPTAFAVFSLLFSVGTGFAQCDKSTVLISSKTEYLDGEGALQRTVEEACVIKIGKTEITISPAGHDVMTGAISSTVCDWSEPFKTGKTTVEAKFAKEGEETESNATISIEGKDGKITCLMKQKEKPDRTIRATIDKFEEQKADPKP